MASVARIAVMTIQTRRERERAERERLIVTAARDLAEAEGWDAVTTRRLAAEIEYSQPVLYSHFKGKGAIMAADSGRSGDGGWRGAGSGGTTWVRASARGAAPHPRGPRTGQVGGGRPGAYTDGTERARRAGPRGATDAMFTAPCVDLPFRHGPRPRLAAPGRRSVKLLCRPWNPAVRPRREDAGGCSTGAVLRRVRPT
ncbi:TetR/AcrR family transcriptional regulator [Streptomyces violaceorubidus]